MSGKVALMFRPRRAQAALIALLIGTGCRSGPVQAPTGPMLANFQNQLAHPTVVPYDPGRPIVGALLTVPARRGDMATVWLRTITTDRPRSWLIPSLTVHQIEAVLNRRGTYVAVQDRSGGFVGLLALGETDRLTAESFDDMGVAEGVLLKGQTATVAVRLPWARLGRISVFETTGSGTVGRLHYFVPFRLFPPPPGGRSWEVVSG